MEYCLYNLLYISAQKLRSIVSKWSWHFIHVFQIIVTLFSTFYFLKFYAVRKLEIAISWRIRVISVEKQQRVW